MTDRMELKCGQFSVFQILKHVLFKVFYSFNVAFNFQKVLFHYFMSFALMFFIRRLQRRIGHEVSTAATGALFQKRVALSVIAAINKNAMSANLQRLPSSIPAQHFCG